MAHNSIWDDDLVGRQKDAELLISYIFQKLEYRENAGQPRSYVVNIDAPWGSGKTFFMSRLQQQLKEEGYLVASVNAWVDDHSDDPLTAVLSEIDLVASKGQKAKTNFKAIRKNAGKIIVTAATGIGKQFLKKYTGDAAAEIGELITGKSAEQTEIDNILIEGTSAANEQIWGELSDKLIDSFRDQKRSLQDFRASFEKFVLGLRTLDPKHAQIFVLIDELDRCRPAYAIAMLERVKHLFDVSGAVFLIATDTAQLHHAIKVIYGQGFDSERYLFRFFHRQYQLPTQSKLSFISNRLVGIIGSSKVSFPSSDDFAEYFDACASAFGLSLRDLEQCVDLLSDTILMWQNRAKIELVYLLPIIVISKVKSSIFSRMTGTGLTGSDRNELNQVLSFKLKFKHTTSDEATAYAFFSSFYDARNWDFQVVNNAMSNSDQSYDRVSRWVIERLYQELLERLQSERGSDSDTTLVKQYPSIVASLSAFSKS